MVCRVGVRVGSQFRALGSLVYLRIFCPAIVSPHSFDLVKQPVQKEVRRHLLLIAKLIQGLANEVPPHLLLCFILLLHFPWVA